MAKAKVDAQPDVSDQVEALEEAVASLTEKNTLLKARIAELTKSDEPPPQPVWYYHPDHGPRLCKDGKCPEGEGWSDSPQ